MPRTRTLKETETVQAVSRAFLILETLARSGRALTLTELAGKVQLKLTTVHRLLTTLIVHGFAEQETATMRYRLGLKAFEIGYAALSSMDVRTIARPIMKELAEKLNETINLAILDRGEVVYIDQIESTKIVIVKMFARVGSRGPAHCTGSGKVLLAGLPDEELRALLRKMRLERFTAQTLTNPDALLAELRRIRLQGYAIDRGERDEGVYCVAAPIRNHEGRVVAALSISAPLQRIQEDEAVNEFIAAARTTADAISARLGYVLDPPQNDRPGIVAPLVKPQHL